MKDMCAYEVIQRLTEALELQGLDEDAINKYFAEKAMVFREEFKLC